MVVDVPAGFPPLTLSIMRCLCALTILSPSASVAQAILIKSLDAFFAAYWVHGRNTIDKEIMSDILLTDVLDGDEERLGKVLECAGKEGKKLLLENTDAAFREGAFGLPWFVCEDAHGNKEGFWGVDHLGCVVEFLGLGEMRMGRWKSVL